jgi:hypothetical protein
MTNVEHLIHAVWPVIVVTVHRWVLDKLLAPIGRAVLKALKPEAVVEKLVDKAEQAIESKLESKHEGENHKN